jgi:hypothetical protein
MKLYSNRNYWASTLSWCLRSSYTIAIITFLSLYDPTQAFFGFNGYNSKALGFASFVCVVVKDSNLGATIINAWAGIAGTLLSSVLCWCVAKAFGDSFHNIYGLCVMIILSFIFQYIEFHPLGKKLAISIVALTFLTDSNSAPDLKLIWIFLSEVLFGCAIAILGNLIPWRRTAASEVEEMISLSANVSRFFLFL